MELAAHKPWVIFQLNNFHQFSIRRGAAYFESFAAEECTIVIVEFIPVPVPFRYLFRSVSLVCIRPFFKDAGVSAQSHGPAHLGVFGALLNFACPVVVPFAHKVDYRVFYKGIEFGAVCFKPANVPAEFNNSCLHSKANPEIRDSFLPGISDRCYFAFDTSRPEPAGDQDAVYFGKKFFRTLFLYLFGIYPLQGYP